MNVTPSARRAIGFAATVVGGIAWMLANVLWLQRWRVGQPLSIDEAGYLSFAYNDYFAWSRGGAATWAQAVLWPTIHSPAAPAAASLVFAAFGPSDLAAIAMVTMSGLGVLLVTGALARRVGSRAVQWLSVLLVATAPGFIVYSRMFIFAVPATLVTILALFALERSRRLASLPWTLAFGLFIGLMPLTRTMVVAFIPGLVVAALAQFLEADGRARRLRNLGLAGALAVGVAAVWLVPSWDLVMEYLTDYGYGQHSFAYASAGTSRQVALFGNVMWDLFLPLMLVMFVGWGAAAVSAVRSMWRRPWSESLRRTVLSPIFPSAILVVIGALALVSSRNVGLGFQLPLLPPAAIVASWGLCRAMRALPSRSIRTTVVVAVVATAAFSVAGAMFPRSWFAQSRYVSVPGVGHVPVSEGSDIDQTYFGYYPPRRDGGFRNGELGDDWAAVNAHMVEGVLAVGAAGCSDTALGFRGLFVNVNTLQLGVLKAQGVPIPVAQIDPVIMEGRKDYDKWLGNGDAAGACQLLTSAGESNEFTPLVNTPALEEAARAAGFGVADVIPAPDGRSIVLWHRTGGGRS